MAKAIVVKVEIEKKLFNPSSMNFPQQGMGMQMDPMMQQQMMFDNGAMGQRPQF